MKYPSSGMLKAQVVLPILRKGVDVRCSMCMVIGGFAFSLNHWLACALSLAQTSGSGSPSGIAVRVDILFFFLSFGTGNSGWGLLLEVTRFFFVLKQEIVPLYERVAGTLVSVFELLTSEDCNVIPCRTDIVSRQFHSTNTVEHADEDSTNTIRRVKRGLKSWGCINTQKTVRWRKS